MSNVLAQDLVHFFTFNKKTYLYEKEIYYCSIGNVIC
jgi:hypothetical protein